MSCAGCFKGFQPSHHPVLMLGLHGSWQLAALLGVCIKGHWGLAPFAHDHCSNSRPSTRNPSAQLTLSQKILSIETLRWCRKTAFLIWNQYAPTTANVTKYVYMQHVFLQTEIYMSYLQHVYWTREYQTNLSNNMYQYLYSRSLLKQTQKQVLPGTNPTIEAELSLPKLLQVFEFCSSATYVLILFWCFTNHSSYISGFLVTTEFPKPMQPWATTKVLHKWHGVKDPAKGPGHLKGAFNLFGWGPF